MVPEICTIDGCASPVRAKGACGMHYARIRTHGDPHANNRVRDPECTLREKTRPTDAGCIEWIGALKTTGYGRITFNGRQVPVHRFAWERENGPIPDGLMVDHICHNRACVNVDHLRLATNQQNAQNRRGASSLNASSGIRGVTWDRSRSKWMAHVTADGQQVFVGRFDDVNKAKKAAASKRAELFTHSQEVC